MPRQTSWALGLLAALALGALAVAGLGLVVGPTRPSVPASGTESPGLDRPARSGPPPAPAVGQAPDARPGLALDQGQRAY
ncbi:MAG TPA: hypothetical protein VFF52_02565, partial [Isosphaeraceae bacterium]|nr:hypothetical protein [Isosphaeraceae bacterium]